MAKIFSFLILLLISGGLYAQTDSTRPPETQTVRLPDTTTSVVRHDSTVKHLSHRDSVRRDSINKAHRAIRDSIRQAQARAQQDSLNAAAIKNTTGSPSAATPSRDSTAAAAAKT